MKLHKLGITNFRGLEDVSLETDKLVNVIVGPNAIGKSTVLEAIRLVRSLLAPRYFEENTQTLISLGAMSQHFRAFGAQGLDYAMLARDVSVPLVVRADFQLSDAEMSFLKANVDQLGLALLRSSIGREDANSQIFLTQFLSSEQGRQALVQTRESAKKAINELTSQKSIQLELTIDTARSIRGTNPLGQAIVALLDQRLPPHRTMFSYFPADRAFPAGEVQIQIGSGEAAQQQQSHLGQPVTKYQRLKNTILNGMLLNSGAERHVKDIFNDILSVLLPGKTLEALFVNEIGLFKVLIKDIASGRVFDIDSMSSGEKGLILTFVLIKQTLYDGGIVLLDEPELHLNPAVCRKIIPFLVEHFLKETGVQAFICTHSPEVLGAAFERDDSNLYHLRSSTDLTRVFRKDQSEMYEALRRLGSSTADVLFSRGTIYVEGEHDADILMEGYFDLISGYKITPLGGRGTVEKEIKHLQHSETEGELEKTQLFIFDNDNKPSALTSSNFVRVIQWDRYCLENYLLEEKILFDLVTRHAKSPPASRGEFGRKLKELALGQLNLIAVRQAYLPREPDNPGLRPEEVRRASFDEAAELIVMRLQKIAEQTANINSSEWKAEFVRQCEAKKAELNEEWQQDVFKKCDGKKLILDLYREYEIKISPLEFKKSLVRQMQNDKTEEWRLIESKLRAEIR
ncbi:AAA ATPase-like protein [Agrobacterium vitis]|nr:AAA ATPase-like protein [Agrobacterium vitis]